MSVIDALLADDEPAVRWRAKVLALGEEPDAALADEVRRSARVQTLLSHRDDAGRITSGRTVYAKWQGAHWILAQLVELGYPSGDESLLPVRDQILDAWLAPEFYDEFEATTKASAYRRKGVPVMNGRHRRCASQQGYPLYFLLRLGLADDRIHALVERLLHWQWPDGGWNCDKDPAASTSTFIHTVHCVRGLAEYARRFDDEAARAAALEGAEVLLSRRLLWRISTGAVIKPEFAKLHFPRYWHYDVLLGLEVMAELGVLDDPRCADALDLLESKRSETGGWPAEATYSKQSDEIAPGADFVDWGGTGRKRLNPWVTTSALGVLRQANRIAVSIR